MRMIVNIAFETFIQGCKDLKDVAQSHELSNVWKNLTFFLGSWIYLLKRQQVDCDEFGTTPYADILFFLCWHRIKASGVLARLALDFFIAPTWKSRDKTILIISKMALIIKESGRLVEKKEKIVAKPLVTLLEQFFVIFIPLSFAIFLLVQWRG